MTETVPSEPSGFQATAAELRRIADALDALEFSGVPYISVSIIPTAKTVEAIDAVTLAVLGKPGATRRDSDGWRHIAQGQVGETHVSIHALVDGPPDPRDVEIDRLRARLAELEPADPTGLLHSRADEADDPTPVSGARVEPHVGAVTDDGLVDETPEHYQISGSAGGPGQNDADCACGVSFTGFDTHAEAQEQLGLHIEAATSPTGLTKKADESRGPLAFTTPVVTYFSFGHGQFDPDTDESLLDHYVTVVAPTYEECREAMFASRFGREWAFDYLAGTKRATEWVRRWTEREVIVAPGTDPEGVEKALTAAADLLLVGE